MRQRSNSNERIHSSPRRNSGALFARAVSLVIAGILFACASEPTALSLAGAYVMSRNANADTLFLRAGGVYRRSFHGPNGLAIDSGRWTLSRDHRMVILRDFPKRWAFVHDLMGDTTNGRVLTRPGTVGLTLSRSWTGKTRLDWYPEFAWRFERTR
jgi:hypothetical protein